MRHFLIDTDTASDDAIAIIMALREPSIKVEAITVLAGNCPLDQCVENALKSIELANTYQPPVYAGASKPLLRKQINGVGVHGEDGLGNLNLSPAAIKVSKGHAVDKLIETAKKYPGELEIVTIGPLTNLALALLNDPELPQLIKHVYIMGGAGFGPGNVTFVAEFNVWADAEAAQIVIGSELSKSIVGWDVCIGDAFFDANDIEQLHKTGPLGEFAARSTQLLREFGRKFGKDGIDLADPTTIAVAMYPEIITKQLKTFAEVDYKSEAGYGQLIIDKFRVSENKHNAVIVYDINAKAFKGKLFSLLLE
ncbi:nucleoside hydrolase [Vibrio sp. S12_S33]|uniref:nucleoside hydrolase n=1 Tax=Vibrio sp. S12_S33 TaxID=2720223 RepID=UPI00178636D2|nr:nucleoside hydrolase [Vibrio sp. S12_S33]MBD1565133.1 ribonucleoside hydrolase [Vibrio sp. S12_S33]